MNYGKAIKIARNTRGLTQKDLADRVGITSSYISRMEAGERKPTTETLETISGALGIPMYLMVLMSSEKKDITGLPENMISRLGNSLLQVVLEKEKKG
jgi:transcriptional regulator with XRE-family HTH domain